jgi:hypothetical protein
MQQCRQQASNMDAGMMREPSMELLCKLQSCCDEWTAHARRVAAHPQSRMEGPLLKAMQGHRLLNSLKKQARSSASHLWGMPS